MTNEDASAAVAPVKTVKLKPMKVTPENWKPYGQLIGPSLDGKEFDSNDAQLDLSRGIPRFYIMHLEDRKSLTFDNITHHASVTQCLGSIGGHSGYLGVALASKVQTRGEPDNLGVQEPVAIDAVWSKDGHSYLPPSPEDVRVFRVDGPHFLKLDAGTWHAGPFFSSDSMEFYNLELSDTNEGFRVGMRTLASLAWIENSRQWIEKSKQQYLAALQTFAGTTRNQQFLADLLSADK